MESESYDNKEIKMEVLSPYHHSEKAEESDEEVQATENIQNLSIQGSPKGTPRHGKDNDMLQHKTDIEDLNSSSHADVIQVDNLEETMEDRENINDESVAKETGSGEMKEIIVDSEDEENKENVPLSQILASAKRSSDSFKLNRSIDGQPRSPLAPIILSPVVTDSPAKKKPRRSVSASPWLRNSPVKRVEKVVKEEQVFISPDRFRPLMGTTPKGFSDRVRSGSNLNSTILSAFSDSPQVARKELDMDSPLDGKRTISRLQETLVEESPDRQGLSAGLHSSFVPNSLENTPSVTPSNDISRNKSIAIEETDEESSPLKSVSISRNESVMESSLLSDDEGQSEEVRDSDPDQSLVEIDSDNSLPCLSVKKKPVRKAVIVSDSESDAEDLRTEEKDVGEAVGSGQSENRKKRKSSESSSLPQSKYVMLSSSDNEQSEEQENIKSDEEEDLMSDNDEEEVEEEEESEREEESIDIDVDSEDEGNKRSTGWWGCSLINDSLSYVLENYLFLFFSLFNYCK